MSTETTCAHCPTPSACVGQGACSRDLRLGVNVNNDSDGPAAAYPSNLARLSRQRREYNIKQHVEAIERAAYALWELGVGRAAFPGPREAWAKLDEEVREHWRLQARTAVAAYQEVRP